MIPLIESLEPLEESEWEAAWAIEIDRRIAEVESGAMKTIPIAEALAQLRAVVGQKQT